MHEPYESPAGLKGVFIDCTEDTQYQSSSQESRDDQSDCPPNCSLSGTSSGTIVGVSFQLSMLQEMCSWSRPKWVSETTPIAERLRREMVRGTWPSTLAKKYQDPYLRAIWEHMIHEISL